MNPQEKNRDFRVFLLQVPKALASNACWTIRASTSRTCLDALLKMEKCSVTASYRVGAYPDRRTSLPRSACTPSPGRLPRSACRAYPDRRTGRTSRPELTRPQSVCQCLNSWRGGGSPRHHRRLSGGCGTEPHPGFVARKAASGGPFRRTPRGGVVPSRLVSQEVV